MSKQYEDALQEEINEKADKIASQLPDFCRKYFDHMKTIDRSARTRLQYAYDLKRFFDFLQEQAGFSDVELRKCSSAAILDQLSFDDIQEYLNTLNQTSKTNGNGKGKKHRTSSSFKARNISTLRSFYKFYYKHGEIEKDMANLMEMPKIKNIEKKALDPDDVARILEASRSHCERNGGLNLLRDQAILTLLFGTGIRVSELVGIDTSDVDFYDASILITRKGGDQDVVYFADEVETVLKDYLNNERPKCTDKAFFLSSRKKRISVRMVQELISTCGKEAGLNFRITPHTARRSYGTSLYENSGDIDLVADSLHHRSIQTTRRYIKKSEDNKRKAQKLSSELFKK